MYFFSEKINCAGTSIPARFEEAADDDFRKMMDVNYMVNFPYY